MANNKIFETVPVRTPRRSTFDLSNTFKTTGKLSQLIPVACIETLPSDKFSIDSTFDVRLCPLKQPIMDQMDARVEWFFVPNSLIWAHWSEFITQSNQGRDPGAPGDIPTEMAHFTITSAQTGNGTLADYLGIGSLKSNKKINALPFLAYQQIYSDYYRNEGTSVPIPGYVYGNYSDDYTDVRGAITELRHRCWNKDVFTTMQADTVGSTITTDLTGSIEGTVDDQDVSGDATVQLSFGQLALLRASAKWNYNQQIGGSRYQESILAHYGTLPSDTTMRRAVFLGSSKALVDVNGVVNQTGANVPGNMAGLGYIAAAQNHPFTFNCQDHGWIIGIFSVMPKASYLNGISRYLIKTGVDDVAFPEFEGIGEQEVYKAELNSDVPVSADTYHVAGYNQRYYEYKQIPDTVHGGLKDLSGDVGAYTMVRNISWTGIDNDFVQPGDYETSFARCFANTSAFGSGAYHFVAGVNMNIKANRPLSEYSIPQF